MAPPQFDDFSKTVTDILTDDFGEKKFLKTKYTTPDVMGNSVGVTSEVSLKNYSGKLSGKWKHDCGFNLEKLSMDGKGMKYEASFSKLTPGVTLKANGEVNLSKPITKVEAQFTQDTLTSSVTTDSSFDSTTASLVLGHDGIQVGGAVNFKRTDGIQDYPLALGYGDSKYFAALSAEDKLRKFGLAAKYVVCEHFTVAFAGHSGLEFSNGSPNKAELGATYKMNKTTTAKAKYAFVDGQKSGNNAGSLEAALNTTPLKKVNLTAGVAIPIAGIADLNSYRYGAGITLG